MVLLLKSSNFVFQIRFVDAGDDVIEAVQAKVVGRGAGS